MTIPERDTIPDLCPSCLIGSLDGRSCRNGKRVLSWLANLSHRDRAEFYAPVSRSQRSENSYNSSSANHSTRHVRTIAYSYTALPQPTFELCAHVLVCGSPLDAFHSTGGYKQESLPFFVYGNVSDKPSLCRDVACCKQASRCVPFLGLLLYSALNTLGWQLEHGLDAFLCSGVLSPAFSPVYKPS